MHYFFAPPCRLLVSLNKEGRGRERDGVIHCCEPTRVCFNSTSINGISTMHVYICRTYVHVYVWMYALYVLGLLPQLHIAIHRIHTHTLTAYSPDMMVHCRVLCVYNMCTIHTYNTLFHSHQKPLVPKVGTHNHSTDCIMQYALVKEALQTCTPE